MDKIRNKNIIPYTLTAVFFGVFYYFLPFAGDDWAWGSSLGLERLKNAFDGYNGRYVGNMLIILVTRSVIAKVVICSLVMLLLIFIISKIFDGIKKSSLNFLLAFFSVLVLVLPNQIAFGELQPFQIFGSTVAWLSGFTNYVVPSALILVYYYFVTNKGHESLPVYILLLFDGIIACLCVEHYTLFCVAFSFCVIAYRYFFYKKLCKKSLFFFSGSLIGALVMFSNSSYRLMQKGNVSDNQRAVGFLGSLKNYSVYIFGKNADRLPVIIFETVLLLGIAAFFVFFGVKTFKAVKSKNVFNLLPMLCLVVMTVPLLFTNSGKEIYVVAPRCYFLQYFMLVIFFYRKLSLKPKGKSFAAGVKAGFAVLIAVTCVLFARLDYMGYLRDSKVNVALENNYSTVEIIEYPKSVEHIQWAGNFINEDTFIKRYIKFKNIPPDKEIKIVKA